MEWYEHHFVKQTSHKWTVTSLAGIIYQNDFMYKLSWRSVDDTPDGTQQRGPRLVVKHYHDACVGQLLHFICFPLTTTQRKMLHIWDLKNDKKTTQYIITFITIIIRWFTHIVYNTVKLATHQLVNLCSSIRSQRLAFIRYVLKILQHSESARSGLQPPQWRHPPGQLQQLLIRQIESDSGLCQFHLGCSLRWHQKEGAGRAKKTVRNSDALDQRSNKHL